jgi:DNA-binding response OmpR family regulator
MSEIENHILYVEDDLNLGYVTKDNLTLAGYTVCHCVSGKEAITAIENNSFSLCLLDIMLPLVDGFEIAEIIRKKDKNIPIIFLSAKSLTEDKIRGLKIGADDYITKPFSIEELLLKIKMFIRRSRSKDIESRTLKLEPIGNYAFDAENYTLTIKKQTKKLTQKEAELLALFCLHKNQLIKREDILTKIWGDDDYFLGRSLDVFISRLRNYLKEDKNIVIENIHGVGFRMNC